MGGIQSVYIEGTPTTETPKSIDLGVTEKFYRRSSTALLGMADEWSASLWAKPVAFGSLVILLFWDSPVQVNDMLIRSRGDLANDPAEVLLIDSAGSVLKDYLWDNYFTLNTWSHMVVTWDGTDLTMYRDGSVVAPSSTPQDNSGSMADTVRRIEYGGSAFGFEWSGLVGPTGWWNVALDSSNVTEIFNQKFDINLTQNSGNYNQASALKHYYRQSDQDIGETDRVGSLDFVNSINLSAADISDDVPS